ncbi:MAG: MBL fold metallo-hydrolase [Trueperaceae bacterium]|nr:MBL fold metallo-hydrolase [Trueperaceae bacterium]
MTTPSPQDAAAAVLLSAGAAETVTGSCHLLRIGDARILVDCGMFQGPPQLERRNREPFPFGPAEVHAVLLTHAHLDHVGRLPKLIADGFEGPVLAAPGTRTIAEIILRDAAKIAREDRARALRKARRAGREGDVEPLPYEEQDVDRALDAMRTVSFGDTVDVVGLKVRFHPAGHVIGSAWLEIDDGEGTIIASGDLGNRESILHPPPDGPKRARAVLCEATYADRTHRSREATRAELREVLAEAAEAGGRVLIPTFALERTQTVLYEIARLQRSGEIPELPVFLDSPMATRMTAVYQEHVGRFRPEVRELVDAGIDPFAPPRFETTVSSDESRALNDLDEPAIVLAGSGMMTGGRIVHHLKHHIWKPETHLIVVGYQASGTLGRALVDGAQRVRLVGDEIAVRGRIHTIGGLSAHADRDDLTAWLADSGDASVHLVHGEPDVLASFRDHLRQRGWSAEVAKDGVASELRIER